jgi:hypothetical protein
MEGIRVLIYHIGGVLGISTNNNTNVGDNHTNSNSNTGVGNTGCSTNANSNAEQALVNEVLGTQKDGTLEFAALSPHLMKAGAGLMSQSQMSESQAKVSAAAIGLLMKESSEAACPNGDDEDGFLQYIESTTKALLEEDTQNLHRGRGIKIAAGMFTSSAEYLKTTGAATCSANSTNISSLYNQLQQQPASIEAIEGGGVYREEKWFSNYKKNWEADMMKLVAAGKIPQPTKLEKTGAAGAQVVEEVPANITLSCLWASQPGYHFSGQLLGGLCQLPRELGRDIRRICCRACAADWRPTLNTWQKFAHSVGATNKVRGLKTEHFPEGAPIMHWNAPIIGNLTKRTTEKEVL